MLLAFLNQRKERKAAKGMAAAREGTWRRGEERRFLTLLPLEVVLERVTPLKEIRFLSPSLPHSLTPSIQCHIPDSVTTTIEQGWARPLYYSKSIYRYDVLARGKMLKVVGTLHRGING